MATVLLILGGESGDWEYFGKGGLRALGGRLWIHRWSAVCFGTEVRGVGAFRREVGGRVIVGCAAGVVWLSS